MGPAKRIRAKTKEFREKVREFREDVKNLSFSQFNKKYPSRDLGDTNK